MDLPPVLKAGSSGRSNYGESEKINTVLCPFLNGYRDRPVTKPWPSRDNRVTVPWPSRYIRVTIKSENRLMVAYDKSEMRRFISTIRFISHIRFTPTGSFAFHFLIIWFSPGNYGYACAFTQKPSKCACANNGAQNDLFPGKCACSYFRLRENAHADNPRWFR